MTDAAVRSLMLMEHSASTARLLNLHRQWRRRQGEEGAGAGEKDAPFFQNPVLDRCFIIKHRLRRDELDAFSARRRGATKIMLPIDSSDLKLGARSVFVGQRHAEKLLRRMFGDDFCTGPDFKLLKILDGLPTLDPFLLREHLKRHGRNPARRYFEVSDADLARMFSFVEDQITPLVRISFADEGGAQADQTAKLVSKILETRGDADMEPLRKTLRLERHEYEEGVFCWKGFLYYKWCLGEIVGHVPAVLEQIGRIEPLGQFDGVTREALERSRASLRRGVLRSLSVTRATLQVYDDAYLNLTENRRPTAFREFLLDAPKLFAALGHRLGAVSHVVSFWRYRFPAGAPLRIGVEELLDILSEFEDGISAPALDDELGVAA